MSLNSEELNLLIFHYLEEAGFTHTSFTFKQECGIFGKEVDVPKGSLVGLAMKGLQYMEIEAHVNEDGFEKRCHAPFTILGDHVCELPTPQAGTKRARTRKEGVDTNTHPSIPEKRIKEIEKVEVKPVEVNAEVEVEDEEVVGEPEVAMEEDPVEEMDVVVATMSDKGDEKEPELLDIDPRDKPFEILVEQGKTILKGHEHEVFICAWNPMFPTHMFTGGHEGGCRVWRFPSGSKSDKISSFYLSCPKSPHTVQGATAMDWHPRGTLLAIGSQDGTLRQYSHNGWMRFKSDTLHSPILAVKYNKRGTLICAVSVTLGASVLESGDGKVVATPSWHTDTVTDVDWKDDRVLTTCSIDGTIATAKFNDPNPIISFLGHQDSVNCVLWDPTATVLASCSDDLTVKLWSLTSKDPLMELKGHQASISTVRWCPTTKQDGSRLIASASDDKSVMIWDTTKGTNLFTFSDHTERVSAIAFSPDGKYLATGAFDSSVFVYNTKDGKLAKSFYRPGEIFDVKWSPNGDSVVATFSDNSVVMFEVSI